MSRKILHKLLISIFIYVFSSTGIEAQNIEINANQEPLNEVLYSLGLAYDLQFSYSDNLLANCVISDSSSYESIGAALESLLAHCDYDFKVTNDVFVIYLEQTRRDNTNQKILYLYNRQTIHEKSDEALLYIDIHGIRFSDQMNGDYCKYSKGII